MAHALIMNPRSYYDLEKRVKSCGLLTVILIIIFCKERDKLLNELKDGILKCMGIEEKEVS